MQRHKITSILLTSLFLGCLPVYSDTATDTLSDTSSSGDGSSGTSGDPTTGDPTTSSTSSDPISTGTTEVSTTASTTGEETTGSSTGETWPQPGDPFGPCKNPGGRLFCDESGPIFCIPVGDSAPACIKNVCPSDFPGAGCTCLPSGVGIIPCTDSMTCPFDGMQCIDSICAYPD